MTNANTSILMGAIEHRSDLIDSHAILQIKTVEHSKDREYTDIISVRLRLSQKQYDLLTVGRVILINGKVAGDDKLYRIQGFSF